MISFGSMVNSEKVSDKFAKLGLTKPGNNIEGLKTKAEIAKDFPALPTESLGRSQVKADNLKNQNSKKLELSDDDKNFISKLSSTMYGFQPNGNNFWVHSKKPVPGGIPNVTMGDGKIQNGLSRHRFVKELFKDAPQAFQIAGKDVLGENKLITVINNSETGKMTVYTSDANGTHSMPAKGMGTKTMALVLLTNFKDINGVTLWTK